MTFESTLPSSSVPSSFFLGGGREEGGGIVGQHWHTWTKMC